MTLRNLASIIVCFLFLGPIALAAPETAQEEPDKAEQVVRSSINKMGGERYLGVHSLQSEGRYFRFRKGRKAFARFFDWTVYSPHVRSRFQLGKGKRQTVSVHNLELDKGWRLEGETEVTELSVEEMKAFKRAVNSDLDYLLRRRLDEEGLKLFYYGPDDIQYGSGSLEAVEFIDPSNASVVVYFDRESHLPKKYETHFTDNVGVRHKQEFELYNWHNVDGVMIPFNTDGFVDGEMTSQRFIDQITVNPTFAQTLFLEPEVKEKKKKKGKKKDDS